MNEISAIALLFLAAYATNIYLKERRKISRAEFQRASEIQMEVFFRQYSKDVLSVIEKTVGHNFPIASDIELENAKKQIEEYNKRKK